MRLIDAHALYREYQEKVCDGIACHECKATNKDGTCKLDLFISTAPTIDEVEVVRCKVCKYRRTEDCPMCNECGKKAYPTADNDFCSFGERKERASR